jgi:hypothetical protein
LLRTTQLDDSTLCLIQSSLLVLIYADRTDLAEPWCDWWLTEAKARRATTWQAMFISTRSDIAIRRSEVRAAQRYGELARSLVARSAWGIAIGSALANLSIDAVQVLLQLGRRDEATALAAEQLARPAGARGPSGRRAAPRAASRPALGQRMADDGDRSGLQRPPGGLTRC